MKKLASVLVVLLVASSAYALPGRACYIMDDNTTTLVVDGVDDNDMTKSGPTLTESTDVPFTTYPNGDPYPLNRSAEFHVASLDKALLTSMTSANTLYDLTDSHTVEFWVKPTGEFQTTETEIQLFNSRMDTGNTDYLQMRTLGTTMDLSAYWDYSASVTAPSAVPAGVWTHVALTIDSSTSGIDMEAFINGLSVATNSNADPVTGDYFVRFVLGSDDSINRYNFDGLMDEVIITDGIVSDADILLHASQSIVPEPATMTLLAIGAFGLIRRRK